MVSIEKFAHFEELTSHLHSIGNSLDIIQSSTSLNLLISTCNGYNDIQRPWKQWLSRSKMLYCSSIRFKLQCPDIINLLKFSCRFWIENNSSSEPFLPGKFLVFKFHFKAIPTSKNLCFLSLFPSLSFLFTIAILKMKRFFTVRTGITLHPVLCECVLESTQLEGEKISFMTRRMEEKQHKGNGQEMV